MVLFYVFGLDVFVEGCFEFLFFLVFLLDDFLLFFDFLEEELFFGFVILVVLIFLIELIDFLK